MLSSWSVDAKVKLVDFGCALNRERSQEENPSSFVGMHFLSPPSFLSLFFFPAWAEPLLVRVCVFGV
jgi:hypothetical protein